MREKNIAPTITCAAPWRLTQATPLENYRFAVEFIDGTNGFVEMQQLIMNTKAGVFARLKDIDAFNQVYLEHGAVTWPDEIDLAPDTMYDVIKQDGAWVLIGPQEKEHYQYHPVQAK